MFFTATHPKARVPHICDTCARIINTGEVYKRGFAADGEVWTWKECAHCEAMVRLYPEVVWDETYDRDTFLDWDPDTFVGMLRRDRMLNHLWRHGNGELAAIPSGEA